MNIDINGFGSALRDYKSQSHEGMTKEQIKTDLQEIFDKFGVNASNFFTINMAIEPHKEASLVPYIDKMAEGIIKNEEMKKQWREAVEKKRNSENLDKMDDGSNKNKPNQQKESKRRKKPSFCFNVSEVGDLPLEAAKGYLTRRMKLRGYTEEEINETPDDLSVLGVDDKKMELNINPDASLLDQMVELSKKLYLLLVNNTPISEVRNLTMTELLTKAKDKNLSFSHSSEDGSLIKGDINTEEPDIEVTIGADGNKGANVENDKLKEEDLEEIEKYGIEGIKTHSEMEEFRTSEEYKQILLSQQLEKSLDLFDSAN